MKGLLVIEGIIVANGFKTTHKEMLSDPKVQSIRLPYAQPMILVGLTVIGIHRAMQNRPTFVLTKT